MADTTGYSPHGESATEAASTLSEIVEQRQRYQKLMSWFRDSARAFGDWRRDAVEDLEFVSGKQWSDADRQKLLHEGRPVVTINKMLRPVLTLLGLQREQATDPRLLPFESADVLPARIMTTLVKHAMRVGRQERADNKVFEQKAITGLGFWKVCVTYERSPLGEIVVKPLSGLSVFPDPNFLEEGWEESNYVFHVDWLTLDEARVRFPEHADYMKSKYGTWIKEGVSEVDGAMSETGDWLASQRTFWDKENQRAQVLECWYKEKVVIEVAVNTDTGAVETDEQRVAVMKRVVQAMPVTGIEFVPFVKTQVRVAYILGDKLLEDDVPPANYPQDRFPIFPAVGYYFAGVPFGVAAVMKDPQREKNKRRAGLIEMVGRMPHSGFFNKTSGGADRRELENFANGNGKVINYESEKPEKIDPPQISQGLILLENKADQEVHDLIGASDEMMGATTQKTVSGESIRERKHSSMLSQGYLLEGFKDERQEVIKYLIDMIKLVYTPGRAYRVLNTMILRQAQDEQMRQLQQVDQETLDTALHKSFEVDYDVVIAEQPQEASEKVGQWQSLLQLMQIPALQGLVPPDVIVDAAKEATVLAPDIADRIKTHITQMQQNQAMQANQNMMANLGGAAIDVLKGQAQPPGQPQQQGLQGAVTGSPQAPTQVQPQPGIASPPKAPGVPSLPKPQ